MHTLFNQPYDGNLEQELIYHINTNNIERIFIVVAYAKESGVRKLISYFNPLLQSNCSITVCVGIDQFNTSKEAIELLLQNTSELYVFHIRNLTITMHPKLYFLESADSEVLFVGSNNLTQGGLVTNDEIFTSTTQLSELTKGRLNNIIERYTNTNSSFIHSVSEEFIASLISNGYILTENQINSQLRTNNNNSNQSPNNTTRESLFGTTSRRSSVSGPSPTVEIPVVNPNSFNGETSETGSNEIQLAEQSTLTILNQINTYETLYAGGYEEFVDTISETKGYYHIPQGVHLGHIFYIVKSIGDNRNTPIELDYRLTLFENSTSSTNGELVRQTRYKLALLMELLLIDDYRLNNPLTSTFNLQLNNNGEILYRILENFVEDPDNFYGFRNNNEYTWNMLNNKQYYNNFVFNLPTSEKMVLFRLMSNLALFEITINCLRDLGVSSVTKDYFYEGLWSEPTIINWMSSIRTGVPLPGFNTPTRTSLEHRLPFIIDLLIIFDVIEWNNPNNNYTILPHL